jgi:hypothetical protein
MLPFMAQRIMEQRKARYDWFVYSEEDVLPHDASFFGKLGAFQKNFGARRVLQPNRYEVNAAALRAKTYIGRPADRPDVASLLVCARNGKPPRAA